MSIGSDDVRQRFIDYFVERGHKHVSSSSLIPAEDPTLLFTNAGMNQFKSVFLGETERTMERAVTSQKCMRVSGKHNDLETVGPSPYHHTFFEMLGNFSFGDYFKREAIRMAWELFTEVFELPRERLWATVYLDDDEADELWRGETDLLPGRVVRLGKEDNYWSMGDTGPCGPCSELHYDYDLAEAGPIEGQPDFDSQRFIELWNLVFMQFNATADGQTAPLPAPNIDTGAGLERLTAVLQGHRSNYDTDLFQPVILSVAAGCGQRYGASTEADVALRAIADHSRALAFLLADGVMPANEGRGYVLRRVLRRAMRFGMKIGYEQPFLHESALTVVDRMRGTYGELEEHRDVIGRVIRSEEERFLKTLAQGSTRFNELVAELKAGADTVIPGAEAFKLYDTHGLPIEMTREFAEAEALTIDEAGFVEAMEAQRTRARSARKSGTDAGDLELLRELGAELGATEFLAYSHTQIDETRVTAVLRDGERVESAAPGSTVRVILERTPFYAESGGQVGDCGSLSWDGGRAQVLDCQRPVAGVIVHTAEVIEGELRQDVLVCAQVDAERRDRIRRNHTATHLLHAALRESLGEHVRQAGSLVEPERLRFDFAHYHALEQDDLDALEATVNSNVRRDDPVRTDETSYDEAIARGALAFFGEKYGDQVRVVDVSGVSTELCGGTHVDRTGQIGGFVIQREESVAAGTRRIVAVTGQEALDSLQRYRGVVHETAQRVKVPADDLVDAVGRMTDRLQQAERELEELRLKVASAQAGDAAQPVDVAGVAVLAREVEGLDAGGMRALVDDLRAKLGSGVVILGTRSGEKASFVVGVTADLTERISAGDVVKQVAAVVGGGGGGRRELAQAGGPDAAKLSEALSKAPELIGDLLK